MMTQSLSDENTEEICNENTKEVKVPRTWSTTKIPQYQLPDYLKKDPVLFQFFKRLHYDDKNFIAVVVGEVGAGKTECKGSKVLMSSGDFKNVEDIKIGDYIFSPGFENNKMNKNAKVIETHSRFEPNCFSLVEKSTNKILYSAAYNHELPVKFKNLTRKYISIPSNPVVISFELAYEYTQSGGVLISYTQDKREVECIVKKYKSSEVYGFEIDSPSHMYVTDNNMITHNSCTAINIARALDITPLGNGMFRKNFVIKQGPDGKGTPECRVVFGPSQFMNLIKSGLPRGSIIVWDEAGIGNDAQKWNDKKSQLIKHVMQTFRSRNYGIFMTVPDKESITLNTRRLVSCYIDVNKRDDTHAYVDIRWLSRARGTEKTQTYYKYPVFKDPISGKLKKVVKYKVPRLNADVEREYNKIKNNTIQDMYDYYQKELEFMEKELGDKSNTTGTGAAIKLKKFNMATCTDIAKSKIEELRNDDTSISAAKIMYTLSKSGFDCNGTNAKKVAEMLKEYDTLGVN